MYSCRTFIGQLRQEYDQPARYDQYVDIRDCHQYETDKDAVRGTLTVLDWKKAEHNAKVHSGDYSEVEPVAAQLLAEEGIADADIDKRSPVYGKLCSGLLRAKNKGFRIPAGEIVW